MTVRAALFDLDGTLLDTAPDLAGAVNELRAERGLASLPSHELAPLCSFGARGMLARGLDLRPGDAEYDATHQAFLARYAARLTCQTGPYPGIRDLITDITADGWAWGVVTNKTEALARPLMAAMAFDPDAACVIGGDSASAPKPDPAPIRLGLERIGADPATSVYVGDSARDMTAGRAAGLATIGVAYGYIPEGDDVSGWPADRIVDGVAAIRPAIDHLTKSRQTGEHGRQRPAGL